MGVRPASFLALFALLFCGCGPAENDLVRVERTLVLEDPLSLDLRTLQGEIVRRIPEAVVLEARSDRLRLSLPEDAVLALPGLCPFEPAATVSVRALVHLESAPPPLGYDMPFRIEVSPGCREAMRGRLTWTSARGTPLTVRQNGFVVEGRTAPPDAVLLAARRGVGIVPISAAHTGEDVLTLRYELVTDGGPVVLTRTVRVRASQRVSGVPSVPTGSSLHLFGGPFTVVESPAGHPPLLEGPLASGLVRATFAASGRYVLASGERTLSLRAGEHRETPLDCGRAECHASAAEHALDSPMTTALHGHLASDQPLSCAVPCHATSEPGLPDGGFAHVARDHGFHAPLEEPEDPLGELPRGLRRLAGVGCTACHGPGAIPEESARWAILRTDVCAVCHDAPPRYGHVAAWAESAMAAADRDPRTHEGPCAGCHTTDGLLSRIGARVAAVGPSAVPEEARPIGIACAACHAPHAAHGASLVREVPVPAPFADAPGVQPICVVCHAPIEGEVRAAQAVFALGRGAIDPESGAPLVGTDAHAPIACTGCHASSPGGSLERGGGHAFAIDRARCATPGCHVPEDPVLEEESLSRERAALLARIEALGLSTLEHDGEDGVPIPGPDADSAGRVRYDLALFRSDRAAFVHGPGYAEAVLRAMEAAAHE